ncbi:uncharacterized protein WM277_010576 isoform 3-T3 [Molossus nigricans]
METRTALRDPAHLSDNPHQLLHPKDPACTIYASQNFDSAIHPKASFAVSGNTYLKLQVLLEAKAFVLKGGARHRLWRQGRPLGTLLTSVTTLISSCTPCRMSHTLPMSTGQTVQCVLVENNRRICWH